MPSTVRSSWQQTMQKVCFSPWVMFSSFRLLFLLHQLLLPIPMPSHGKQEQREAGGHRQQRSGQVVQDHGEGGGVPAEDPHGLAEDLEGVHRGDDADDSSSAPRAASIGSCRLLFSTATPQPLLPPASLRELLPAVRGRRRNPRRGCAAVAEEAPLEEAGGVARERKRTDAGGGDDTVDGEWADPKVEASIKDSSKNTATGRGRGRVRGRGRGAARKAATRSGCFPSVSEQSEKADLEAIVDDHCKILKEVKPVVHDSPRIPTVKMEIMTLDEWFDRMEKYIPNVINGIANEIISEIKAKAERFKENVANSLDPGQRDRCGH